MKYAIQAIMYDGAWMYVTEDSPDGGIQVKTYASAELAEEVAETWRLTGKEHNVKVVTYDENGDR